MNKSCGNCKYFTKIRRLGGICEKWDCRTGPQVHANDCKGFKRIKFHKTELFSETMPWYK